MDDVPGMDALRDLPEWIDNVVDGATGGIDATMGDGGGLPGMVGGMRGMRGVDGIRGIDRLGRTVGARAGGVRIRSARGGTNGDGWEDWSDGMDDVPGMDALRDLPDWIDNVVDGATGGIDTMTGDGGRLAAVLDALDSSGNGAGAGAGDSLPLDGVSPPVMDALRALPAAVTPATRNVAAGAMRAAAGGGTRLPTLLTAATEVILPTVCSFAVQSVGAPTALAGGASPSTGGAAPSDGAIAALVASLGAQLGPLLGEGPAEGVAMAAGIGVRDPAVLAVLQMLRREGVARGGGAGDNAAGDGLSPLAPSPMPSAPLPRPLSPPPPRPPPTAPLLVVPPPPLQAGAAGPPVASLQRALTAVGLMAAGDVDAPGCAGQYGPATAAAVARLQRNFELDVPVLGVYDDLTAASMRSLLDAPEPVVAAAGSAFGEGVDATP